MSKTKQYLETLEERKVAELNADSAWEHSQHSEWYANCSECYKLCKYCMGTGVVERTEWIDTDTSYPVYRACVCQSNEEQKIYENNRTIGKENNGKRYRNKNAR